MDFINLHNQTSASILDSLCSVKDLFKRAKELDQSAVAITDHGSLGAAWEALKESKETGIKLIIGCELYFKHDVSNQDEKFKHIILIAKNAKGYRNLLTLNKLGFDNNAFDGKKVYSIIDWKLLEEYSDGLICLTACGSGIICNALMHKKFDDAEHFLLELKRIFGENLGLEVLANNMRRASNFYSDEIDQIFLNRQLINLGKKHNVKVIAASNTHYINKEDHETHDVLLAIGSHQPVYSNFRTKYNVSDFYLKSREEIVTFFSRNYGGELANQLCDNTLYFSNLCENPEWIDPKFSNPNGKELPIFPVQDEPDYKEFLTWKNSYDNSLNYKEDTLYIKYKCNKILPKYMENKKFDWKTKEIYLKRVAEELDVFDYCGVSSYMLIVADYANWARNNGVSVGPGRGSVAGSFICFLLDIHKADSIQYDLVFERFHNKIKKSIADIDLDFSQRDRKRVIKYLSNKYGENNVAHVSNLNTITPKVYARDIARCCELGGTKEKAVELGTNVADCISYDIHSIDKLMQVSPLFMEYCKKYPELLKYKEICGAARNNSTHAAGIIVSARPLLGLVPLRKDKDGTTALEYTKDAAEENGLVKMDLLGLSTLDIIDLTKSLIKKANKKIPIINYDEYDQKTYDLISSGDTFGIFQFGTSAGTIDLCRKIKPKSMEDLAIITTIARPASKEIREDFVKTKNGDKAIKLFHPSLARAFDKTYGFPLYDESLLILAQDVAGWDLGEADKLRKLTKEKGKNPEKARKWKKEFIAGAVNNNILEKDAKGIWEEIIEPYSLYSFNKSHAIVYSMISYHTAFLKAHFPIEFLMANLMFEIKSGSPDAKINIEKIKKEIRAHSVEILPPNLNDSKLSYDLQGNKLLTGLDAMKFVSDEAITDIIEKRPFKDFNDFMLRVDSRKVRSNTIQALVASGCMDSFGLKRKSMFLYCSDYRKKLQVWLKKHDPSKEIFTYSFPEEKEWSINELFALEHFYLAEGFVCKPAVAYKDFFRDKHYVIQNIKQAKNKTNIPSVRGIIRDFFEFKVKKETSKYYGQSMIKAVIEDKYGEQCSLTIFPDRWQQVQDRLKSLKNSKLKFDSGLAFHFSGNVNIYEDDIGIVLDQLYSVAPAPELPADLKAKKINMKKIKDEKSNDINDLESDIIDDLYDQGLINLDDDEEKY